MKTKVYELVLYKKEKIEKITLSSYSLSKFLNDFQNSDYEFVSILKHQINKKDEKNINILRLSSEIEDLLRINNICTLYELINKNKSYLKKIGCTASN